MTQTAPGKSYRKGITMVQLFKMFPDDETATAWVERTRWPDGATCPHCGSDRITHPVKHKTMTHRCKDCRKWFSVRTGTCMESSRLGLQTWVIAIYLLNTCLKDQASMKLHRDLGVTQKTAWHLAHRIREAWEDNGGSLFGGPVEADESHFGGKRKNKSNAERKAAAGRGPVDMEAVVGVKDRETGHVRARHVAQTDIPHVAGFVAAQTKPGAKVYTDEAKVYGALDPWFDREAVNHSVSEFVRGMAHTNGMESFWAMAKRGFNGTYHKFSPKHLQRYIGEFAGCHNTRPADMLEQMAATVAGMVGKRLPYKTLIADNGFSSGARPAARRRISRPARSGRATISPSCAA